MQDKASLQQSMDQLKQQYGEWTYDIPLPFDLWTRGNLQLPHTRLKRVVQIVSDLCKKPLSECRILDLGCLDGLFSIEFAMQGAQTVGVEIREANLKKAIFCKEALGLNNLEFRMDDVRNISVESYGTFDAIICSGLLYHLPASDVISVIQRMHDMVSGVVIIDTHIALKAVKPFKHSDNNTYWGSVYREHAPTASAADKAKALMASADNATSFWFTRPSLVNILKASGFSSAYECFVPIHRNFGKPEQEHRSRCTFVAVKNDTCHIMTSPAANTLVETMPEGSLRYDPDSIIQKLSLLKYKILSKIKRTMG